MSELNRPTPIAPPGAYQTYRILAPQDTDRIASCAEVGCPAWRNGWDTTVDERTPLGAAQALYLRTQAGRSCREFNTATGLTVFRFDSGQRCFADHHTRVETYARIPGDWRAQTGQAFIHRSPADWQEDFGEHQQSLAEELRKG